MVASQVPHFIPTAIASTPTTSWISDLIIEQHSLSRSFSTIPNERAPGDLSIAATGSVINR